MEGIFTLRGYTKRVFNLSSKIVLSGIPLGSLEGQWTAPATLSGERAAAAFFGQIFPLAQVNAQGMVPYRFPAIDPKFTHRLVIGLAGDDGPVRLDAHIIECGCTALDA
jgi:hypothetical protein